MLESLSILLPVHNALATLEANVRRVLDVMPELTDQGELLIIDDGSNDGTDEIAWELMTLYPQVDFVRHPLCLGLAESIRTGVEQTKGQYLLIHDGEGLVNVEQMLSLWQDRDREPVGGGRQRVQARHDSQSSESNWVERLLAWGREPRLSAESEQKIFHLCIVRRRDLGGLPLQGLQTADDLGTRKIGTRTIRRHPAHSPSESMSRKISVLDQIKQRALGRR